MIEMILGAIGKVAAIAALLVGLLFWARKAGRKEKEAEINEQIIDDVYTAQQARDRLQHDDDYAKRVRERFRR